jgi:hypothetical protein
MSNIDRMRVAAVKLLEAQGWKWVDGKWVHPAYPPSPSAMEIANIANQQRGFDL